MQKQFVRTLLLVFVLLDAALVQVAAQPDPVRREFIIQNFRTESGIVLPEARIVYGTYGKLNEAADNAVLLPSHFMAALNGYDWLIGPGRALDPDKLFIIATELFGNGRSSSPSNTPEPHKGPRFPVVTIRDNVNATHRLLTEQLNIKHLRAVIGFSMGAQQAFQWAVSHPDFMDRIVVTSGTAKLTRMALFASRDKSPQSPPMRRSMAETMRRSRQKVLKRRPSSGPPGFSHRNGGARSYGKQRHPRFLCSRSLSSSLRSADRTTLSRR